MTKRKMTRETSEEHSDKRRKTEETEDTEKNKRCPQDVFEIIIERIHGMSENLKKKIGAGPVIAQHHYL